MFTWLWNYFTGYVMISVEGLSLEKFLNLAASGGVKLWDVQRRSYTRLTACVSNSGFAKLRKCIRGHRSCRVHIETKYGVPFKLSFLRFRRALVFGTLLFVAVLAIASLFVWEVSVEGNIMVPREVILKAVSESGGKRFAQKKDLDMLSMAAAAMSADDRIAWAGTKLRGTQLIVEVVESTGEPKLIDKETPVDIVAVKDAVISELTVLEGVAAMDVNMPVRAGDKLILGTIAHEGAPPRLVHARGEAIGRVWYESSARIGNERAIDKRTGNEQIVSRVTIAGWVVPLEGKERYEKYEAQKLVSRSISSLYLPVVYERERQFELVSAREPIEQDEMMAATREMALSKLYAIIPPSSTVLGISAKFTPLEDSLMCELFAEAEETIGVVREIDTQLPDNAEIEDVWTVP